VVAVAQKRGMPHTPTKPRMKPTGTLTPSGTGTRISGEASAGNATVNTMTLQSHPRLLRSPEDETIRLMLRRRPTLAGSTRCSLSLMALLLSVEH
jgi:hypothetical protein